MSAVLAPILAGWGSNRPSDPAHITAHYIIHPHGVLCSVAVRADRVCGFQALTRAWHGNPYDLPCDEGWGIIGSYVAADAAGTGVGRALFAASRAAAQKAGLRWIDATIGADNAAGLSYYGAMGFETWRELPATATSRAAIGKRYAVQGGMNACSGLD